MCVGFTGSQPSPSASIVINIFVRSAWNHESLRTTNTFLKVSSSCPEDCSRRKWPKIPLYISGPSYSRQIQQVLMPERIIGILKINKIQVRLSLLTMTNPNQLCDVLLFVCSKMADETNLSSKLPVADRTREV